ncbi:MAG: hypothetical protein GVY08_01505 [Bacteroidetes bacterium]|jgi:hypothetical protein|nr:hypothetical protein [Bacteroidota bacterium]
MNVYFYKICIALLAAAGMLTMASDQAFSQQTDREGGDSGVIQAPFRGPDVQGGTVTPGTSLENGFLIGRSFIGFDITILDSEREFYSSLFGGLTGFGSDSFTSGAWVAGISVGKQFYLREKFVAAQQQNVNLYIRTGPGIGLGGSNGFVFSDSRHHVGLNGDAILGADLRISDHTSFFMQGGGKLLWYPSLDEVGFLGVPMVSAGFRFNLSNSVPPVRY